MEILLLIAIVVVFLYFVPSFSVLREWNDQAKKKYGNKRKFEQTPREAAGFRGPADTATRINNEEQAENNQGQNQSKQEDAITQETIGEQKTDLPKPAKHEVSEVPTMDDFMRPILEYANQRSGSFGLREITDAMADHFNLSAEARSELTGGGNIDRVYDRTSWSISHLKHAEFLQQTGRGRYEITDAGRKEVKSSNEISVSYLMQNVLAYQRWKQFGTSGANHATKLKEAEGGHEASEVPSMADFMRPILRWASEQPGEFSLREASDAMADYFKLSPEAIRELTEEGNVDRVYDRTNWAVSPHLKEAGLMYSVRRGYWQITEAGKKEAFASNERMTTGYLIRNFPAYQLWKEKKGK